MANTVKEIKLENPVWGPQNNEPAHCFDAYVLYRDTELHTTRSLNQIAKQVEKDPKTIQTWAKQYRWEERVLAYDRYMDSKRMRQIARRKTEMYERQSTLAVAMQQLIAERIRTMPAEELTARDVREWLDVATRIELRARGESTDNLTLNVNDGREVQVQRAMDFFKEMSLAEPGLSDKDKAEIILESFDVKPYEIGLDPNILEIQDGGTAVN